MIGYIFDPRRWESPLIPFERCRWCLSRRCFPVSGYCSRLCQELDEERNPPPPPHMPEAHCPHCVGVPRGWHLPDCPINAPEVLCE